MGRNKGSVTGVIVTQPVVCTQCGTVFQVLGKYRPDGPHPRKYCGCACYHASQSGIRPPWLPENWGGAPKGRVPWNKGRKAPQLSGANNGMYGRTHSQQARQVISEAARRQFAHLLPSDPFANKRTYRHFFMRGWREIRVRALERDDKQCRRCGFSGPRLQVHHVVPFCFCLRHDIENLVTLCVTCHKLVHVSAEPEMQHWLSLPKEADRRNWLVSRLE